MATIDRDYLLEQCKLYLPSSQTLSDAMILALNEFVITKIGDDDSKEAEILCKCLYACGNKNLADSLVDFGSLKREKTGDVEAEYHNNGGKSYWQAWINNLKNVCPLFGYQPTKLTGGSMVKAISYNSPASPLYPLVTDTDIAYIQKDFLS